MSGWLEFFELEIICPKCNKSFDALFCENGDTKDPPEVRAFLASGETSCPHCKAIIREEKLLTSTHTEI